MDIVSIVNMICCCVVSVAMIVMFTVIICRALGGVEE